MFVIIVMLTTELILKFKKKPLQYAEKLTEVIFNEIFVIFDF